MHAEHAGCQWFEQVWNGRDRAAMERLATPDMKAHGADGVTRGLVEFGEFYDLLTSALPDLKVEIINCVRGDDREVVQWRATGTHEGSQTGLPATGHCVDVAGLSLMRLEHGRIAEGWDSYDAVGLMTQLGAAV